MKFKFVCPTKDIISKIDKMCICSTVKSQVVKCFNKDNVYQIEITKAIQSRITKKWYIYYDVLSKNVINGNIIRKQDFKIELEKGYEMHYLKRATQRDFIII